MVKVIIIALQTLESQEDTNVFFLVKCFNIIAFKGVFIVVLPVGNRAVNFGF